ncbi:hypothetical protein [Loktanella salsilacus]|uniref:DUF7742 family protein n=1 Tax=Loktanella salsilacus TaxID=195913 RepID=UPI0037357CCC
MRPVHLTDLDIAARAILARPAAEWPERAASLVTGARLADRYRKRLARRHPVWGDGTLAAAALGVAGRDIAPPQRCDASYVKALQCILTALSENGPFDFCRPALYPIQRMARKQRNGLYPGETS